MNRLLKLTFLLLFISASVTSWSQEFTISSTESKISDKALDEKFTDYKVFNISSAAFKAAVSEKKAHDFVLNLGTLTVQAEIIPAYIRTDDYTLQVQSKDGLRVLQNTGNKVFKGFIKNDRNGKIRLVVDDYFIYGTFEMGGESYFIEPVHLLNNTSQKDEYVVYKESDVRPLKGVRCAADDLAHNQKFLDQHDDNQGQSANRSVGECYKVEHAIASDFTMFNFYGSVTAVENRNLGVLNNVQGNYDNEFADEIEFDVVTQFVSDCASCDPWTTSTDSEALLNSFTNWGNQGNFGVQFDLGSLWSRRDFNGSTIGLAWLSGLCTNLKYHVLTENFGGAGAQTLRVLWAHEIGHNFSATHDNQGDPFIMAPSVSTAQNWSTMSQNQMNALIAQRANQGGCFSNCGGLPTVDITALTQQVCTGGQTVFFDISDSSPEAFDWFWEFDGGTPSTSTERNPTVTYDFPGTYSVTLTVTNASGSSTENFPGFINVDAGGSDILIHNDFQNGIGWPVENSDGGFTWETVPVGGLFFGGNAARVDNFNYTAAGERDAIISPVFSLLGRNSAQLNILHAHRRFNNTQDSLIVYVSTDGGATFNQRIFADAENGSGNFATNPDISSIFVPENEMDWCLDGAFGAGCLTLDLTPFAGEENVAVKIENYNAFGNPIYLGMAYVESACFVVNPPVADFDAAPNEGCVPMLVNFTDLSTNFPDTWLWSFPGGIPETSNEPNPEVLYEVPGTYPVTLTVSNSAGSDELTLNDYIVVGDVPDAMFTSAVVGRTVVFTNETSDADTYIWDFGDGNTSTEFEPTHTYASDGTYTVTLTATNDCGDDVATEELTIDAQPVANFGVDTTAGCVPFTVQFSDSSSDNTTMLSWFFEGGSPDTSSEQNPTVIYNTAGTFDVTLVASNPDGTDTLVMEDLIVVGDKPSAGFGYTVDLRTVTFSDSTSGADSIRWHFGDDSTSTASNPVHTYETDGTYTVLLVAYNDCGSDTAEAEIVISASVTANVTADTTAGCAPLTVNYSDSNSTNGTSRLWIFEGGAPGMSTVMNPTVTYNNPGSFDVTLIVSNDIDSDTAFFEDYIVVNPVPNASFNVSQNGNTVTMMDMSSNADIYNWDFGDGTTSNEPNPSHTYADEGNYVITLIVSNTCGSDTTSRNVSLGSAPIADFESDQDICPGVEVTFDNQSTANATDFQWTFEGGDPMSSSEENPSVVFNEPGSYTVTLIASNSEGSDTIVKEDYITVIGLPTADFDYTESGLEVSFMSMTTNTLNVTWTFGDGAISTELNPVHTYDAEGTYDVTLVAYGECDTVSVTQDVVVQLAPQAALSADVTEGCAPLTVAFTDESIGDVTGYNWTFEGGEPATSDDANPMVTYNTPGSYSVTLVVQNNSGSDTVSLENYIVVNGLPEASFEVDISADTVRFTNTSVGATSYLWSFGDGNTSTEVNPSNEYGDSGAWDVMLIATNECGSDTIMNQVTDVVDVSRALEVHMFPVPADDYLIVDVGSETFGRHQIRIIDMLGRTASLIEFDKRRSQHREQLDVSAMSPATYFVEITSESARVFRKIVIQ